MILGEELRREQVEPRAILVPSARTRFVVTDADGVSHRTSEYDSNRTTSARTLPAPLMSIDDVTTYYGVSRRTVYRLIRSGDLKPVRIGSRLRFRQGDLEPTP